MNRHEEFLSRLLKGEKILIDGGTGTEVERRGVPQLKNAWNAGGALTHPDIIKGIHLDFIKEGAEIIISNTFATCKHLMKEADCLNDFELVQKALKESSELRQVIKSPLVNSDEKHNILLKLFSKVNLHNLTTTFLKVLDNNKRISNIGSIILQFKKINSEKRGDITADITSANILSDDEKNNITNQLKKSLGEKLSLNFDVDEDIIGGLIVKVGSKMIDTSIANKINKLKIAMKGA